jgi:hypothetical protein
MAIVLTILVLELRVPPRGNKRRLRNDSRPGAQAVSGFRARVNPVSAANSSSCYDADERDIIVA